MSKAKYKKGKKIGCFAMFEESNCDFFRVKFGDRWRTIHRSFLISWQYRTLDNFMNNGWIYEAVNKE